MGYRKTNKKIRLTFAPDDELYGLEVQVRGMDVRTWMEVTGVADGTDGEGVGGAILRFAQALIGWNLEESDGTPVPATPEAVQAQDHDLILRLTGAWTDALSGVHRGDPLSVSSPDGGPSPEASIPMAPLSPSPVS